MKLIKIKDLFLLILLITVLININLVFSQVPNKIYNNPTNDIVKIADEAYEKKDYLKANSLYQKYLINDPKNAVVRLKLARTIIKQGSYMLAETHLKNLLTDNPDYTDAVLELGKLLEWEKKLPEMYELYKQHTSTYPQAHKIYIALGDYYRNRGNLKLAKEYYKLSLEIEENPTIRAYLKEEIKQSEKIVDISFLFRNENFTETSDRRTKTLETKFHLTKKADLSFAASFVEFGENQDAYIMLASNFTLIKDSTDFGFILGKGFNEDLYFDIISSIYFNQKIFNFLDFKISILFETFENANCLGFKPEFIYLPTNYLSFAFGYFQANTFYTVTSDTLENTTTHSITLNSYYKWKVWDFGLLLAMGNEALPIIYIEEIGNYTAYMGGGKVTLSPHKHFSLSLELDYQLREAMANKFNSLFSVSFKL
ncbi:MAG: hypothetical protein ABIA04_06565 [Pseudomonadota bacterium]